MKNVTSAMLLMVAVAVPAAAGPIGPGGVPGEACVVIETGAEPATFCTPISAANGSFSFRLDGTLRVGGDDGFEVTALAFDGNADPFLSYAIGVVDIGAPGSFGFTFATPIVSDAYTHAAATFAAGLTGDGRSLSTLDPIAPATRIQAATAAPSFPAVTNLGVDIGAACAGVGVVICTPETADAFFAPTTFGVLQVASFFRTSGGGVVASITGSVELDKDIQAVPEPSVLLLLGSALAVGFSRRRT
jgi:hypothetical protein